MMDPHTYEMVMSFLLGAFAAYVSLTGYLIVRDLKKESRLWKEYMKAYQSYVEIATHRIEEIKNPQYTQEQYEKAKRALDTAHDKWRENNNEPA